MADSCGHTFCQDCLLEVANGQNEWSCPECRSVQSRQPDQLMRNRFIERAVESYNAASRQPADCDVLTITEYEELVASKTQFLQNQVSAAIDEIEKKQSELLAQIKLNPRNNASQKISIELKTGMENFGF